MNRLWQDLQPVGALEELLVKEIAAWYWRLDRALNCEAGEIRRGFTNMSHLMEMIDPLAPSDPVTEHLRACSIG